ncbi:hypothetical protein GEMRC1_007068 [Eukaryota sp. GEM-RC1]
MSDSSPYSDQQSPASDRSLETPSVSPTKQTSLNYGEMLHVEALVKQIEKEEQLRQEADKRRLQETEFCTFSPSISESARSISNRDPLSKRFKDEIEEKKLRLQQLQQQILSEINKESTFSPKTNAYKFANDREDFLTEQQKLEQQRHEKLHQLKSSFTESASFSPSISMYSKTLHREEPVHERLYGLSKNLAKTEEDPLIDRQTGSALFTPRTNHRSPSHEYLRDRPSLFDEAKRRQEVMERRIQEEEAVPPTQPTPISDQSRKLAITRLIRLLKEGVKKLSPETMSLSKSETTKLLRYLGFFKQNPSIVDRTFESSFIERLFSSIPLPSRDVISLSTLIRFSGTCLRWNRTDMIRELQEIDQSFLTEFDDVYVTPVDGHEASFYS